MELDLRCLRVAIVQGELLNPGGRVDALTVLEEEIWGAIQLPADDYPDDVAEPLLDQVAEQAEEFARHGYRLVLIGDRAGLAEALARHGVPEPPSIDPAGEDELRAFLAEVG